jgi:hypothetical protein
MTDIDFTAMDDQFATELMQRVFPVVSNLGVNGFRSMIAAGVAKLVSTSTIPRKKNHP